VVGLAAIATVGADGGGGGSCAAAPLPQEVTLERAINAIQISEADHKILTGSFRIMSNSVPFFLGVSPQKKHLFSHSGSAKIWSKLHSSLGMLPTPRKDNSYK
jgi:hypothetical protein